MNSNSVFEVEEKEGYRGFTFPRPPINNPPSYVLSSSKREEVGESRTTRVT